MGYVIMPSTVMKRPPRTPFLTLEHSPGPDGEEPRATPVVNVYLQTDALAQCDLADFNALMEIGFSDQWFLHSNGTKHAYVRTVHRDAPGKMLTVARLIVRGRQGTRVRYADGVATNLRRSNLIYGEGYSKGHEAVAVEDAEWFTSWGGFARKARA